MAEFTLDCLGEACPVPLMKVQKQMEKMAVGDRICVIFFAIWIFSASECGKSRNYVGSIEFSIILYLFYLLSWRTDR